MYKLNEEKMFYDVADGVAIVIDFSTGVYFGFNKFGTGILDSAIAGGSSKTISEAVKELQGCPENIEETINEFVGKLLNEQILIENDAEEITVEIKDDFIEEGFVPEFEVFSEVQDLILADPIHEVDPEQGWPKLK